MNDATSSSQNQRKVERIALTSPAFEPGGMIPIHYTSEGMNVSPPLAWDPIPDKTESLALVCDDPDFPLRPWTHWLLYEIPPSTKSLAESCPPRASLKNGAVQGTNDFKQIGYGGPAATSALHRYYFRLFALDAMLYLPPGLTKSRLMGCLQGHIVGMGLLIAHYRRKIKNPIHGRDESDGPKSRPARANKPSKR